MGPRAYRRSSYVVAAPGQPRFATSERPALALRVLCELTRRWIDASDRFVTDWKGRGAIGGDRSRASRSGQERAGQMRSTWSSLSDAIARRVAFGVALCGLAAAPRARARRRSPTAPAVRAGAATSMPPPTPPSTRCRRRCWATARIAATPRSARAAPASTASAAPARAPTSVIRARSRAARASARSPTSAPIRATIVPTTASPPAGATASATAPARCRHYPLGALCQPQSCNGSTRTNAFRCSDGACSPTSGQPCDPYQCSPAGDDCLIVCETNADCIGGSFCDNGSCGRKPLGASCTVNDDCNSLICAQGVCCSSDCKGTCESCALPGAAGTCTAVPAGDDPLDQCADGGRTGCGTDGTCDGKRACRLYVSGTVCQDPTCSARRPVRRRDAATAWAPARSGPPVTCDDLHVVRRDDGGRGVHAGRRRHASRGRQPVRQSGRRQLRHRRDLQRRGRVPGLSQRDRVRGGQLPDRRGAHVTAHVQRRDLRSNDHRCLPWRLPVRRAPTTCARQLARSRPRPPTARRPTSAPAPSADRSGCSTKRASPPRPPIARTRRSS